MKNTLCVHGCDLLKMQHSEWYGRHIVHQTWARPGSSSRQLPPHSYAHTWSGKNPGILHVIWNDDDNRRLVHDHYPEYVHVYEKMAYLIHRLDLVRLLYLDRYGGVYADIDYECKAPIVPELLSHEACVVESPLAFEAVQNSLMAAKHSGYPLWRSAADEIVATCTCVWNSKPSDPGYAAIRYFQRYCTRHIAYTAFTTILTGPGPIDRSIVRTRDAITLLPKEAFYRGENAHHHERASWVPRWLLA